MLTQLNYYESFIKKKEIVKEKIVIIKDEEIC